ncbi:MmgE/PrpD family protein [Paraburkholderia fungorum]|uniref:2-methylcitrate dehydratase n=1 Tax=Paraburkholderia fungorum TaxID=134537 RepID=A0A420FK93_9BURK|nr:MmgE/PrpD family protein [Paraburkholderia fungorum]RKF33370.1 2-methylcitrate dehydratase [Paraburkholderia fungorum]
MILETFAQYVADEAKRTLPPEVTHAAKRALIDWFSALLPGTKVSPATNLFHAHASELGQGKSSLPGFATTAHAGVAAWINGSASHAVEFDDIFRDAVYHPGCPTIAAALALAEQHSTTGAALLKAITIGYEVSTRIGAAVQPAHYRYFHTTGTVGCFGAAAAGAALVQPGAAAVALNAMATSATFASGLQQAFRSDAMTKALHAGHAAWVGVMAAQGSGHGITGVADILEGEVGFGAALCASPDWSKVTDGLGSRYNIEKVTQKNHGCCGHTFAAIDAMLALVTEHRLRPDQIRTIRIKTYRVAIEVAGIPQPCSAFEAKFSLAYVVSHAALYGAVRLDAFSADRLADPLLRSLMERVHLEPDPELTAGFPGMRAARVTVVLDDGQQLEHFAPYRRGDPEEPLTDAEIEDKFLELASPVIGDAKAHRLLVNLWQVDELDVVGLTLSALGKNSLTM